MSGTWPSTTAGWRAYFDGHQQLRTDQVGNVELSDSRAAKALVRSLRRFQAGESSGVRLAEEAQDPRLTFLDEDARVAIRAFMDEEHRHGELLARLLGELGGSTAAKDFSTQVFIALRRIFGFRAKLAVLMMAEIIGIAFYETVAEAVDEPMVRHVMSSIHQDEVAHVEFVTLLLRRIIDAPGHAATKVLRRVALVAFLHFTLVLALVGVTVDHYPLMRRVGFTTVFIRSLRIERTVAARLNPFVGRP